jgi:hypothetical protein
LRRKRFDQCLVFVSLVDGSLVQEEHARTAMSMFVDLAMSDPLFFRPSIGPLCELSAKMIATQSLEDNTRQIALEFLTTLCETKPGMMRKGIFLRSLSFSCCCSV